MSKSNPESKIILGEELSPEADRYMAQATAEFNAKQEALKRDWRFGSGGRWGYDQISGIFKLDFPDGARFCAEGQILGSYAEANHSWEWAWNNPYVMEPIKKDSKLVKKLGERLGISYLVTGMVPAPIEEVVSYFCAIGLKATGAIGVYRGKAGAVSLMITLKNPRWEKKGA
jgi:hypothetical protein